MKLKSTLKRIVIKAIDCVLLLFCKKPHIESKTETIRRIAEEHCSIARFGDGEMAYIFGRPIGFQKYDPDLGKRLTEVLHFDGDDKLLIGVSRAIFTSKSDFYRKYRVRYLRNITRILDTNKQYFYTDISRFYRKSPDGKEEVAQINSLKKIWESRDVTMIEGEKSRMGVGNDLFDNVKSIKRILCPAENAYAHYGEILSKSLELIPKDNLVLIALGPTATVLAHDLFLARYQAVDIGHVDISYEWYLRGVANPSERIIIPGKYVNEVSGGDVVDAVSDPDYQKQIIASIGL